MAWISLIVYAFVIFLGVAFDFESFGLRLDKLLFFIHIPSAIFVLIPPYLFATAVSSPRLGWEGWIFAFGGRQPATTKEAAQVRRFLRMLGNASLMMALIGTLVGAILIGQHLTDISDLGPASAVALLTLLYGIVVKLVCQFAESRLESHEEPVAG